MTTLRAEGRTGSRRVGALLALGAAAAVGSAVAATALITGFPVFVGQAVRYGFAALLLAALFRRVPLLTGGQAGRVVLLSATGLVGFNVCLVLALQRVDAGVAGAVIGAVPVVLALLGPLLRRRRPSVRVMVGALVVTAGAAVVQWSGSGTDPIGLLLAVGALAGECGFSLFAVGLVAEIGATATATYAAAAGSVMCGMLAAATEWSELRLPTGAEAGALLYLAVGATAAAFTMSYLAMDRIEVELVGVLAGAVPVFALAAAAVLGVAAVSPTRLGGVLLVGLGIVVAISTRRRPPTVTGRGTAAPEPATPPGGAAG